MVELSKGSWLVAGIIPGVERQPLKKLAPDEDGILKLLERWRCGRSGRRFFDTPSANTAKGPIQGEKRSDHG